MALLGSETPVVSPIKVAFFPIFLFLFDILVSLFGQNTPVLAVPNSAYIFEYLEGFMVFRRALSVLVEFNA